MVGTHISRSLYQRVPGYSTAQATLNMYSILRADMANPRILVVDDMQPLVDMIRRFFRKEYTVIGMPDATAALNYVRQGGNYDCALIDRELPGRLDGNLLYHQLKRSRPHAPVVMMSGYSQQGSNAHADAYFQKPLDMQRLGNTIERLLLTTPQKQSDIYHGHTTWLLQSRS